MRRLGFRENSTDRHQVDTVFHHQSVRHVLLGGWTWHNAFHFAPSTGSVKTVSDLKRMRRNQFLLVAHWESVVRSHAQVLGSGPVGVVRVYKLVGKRVQHVRLRSRKMLRFHSHPNSKIGLRGWTVKHLHHLGICLHIVRVSGKHAGPGIKLIKRQILRKLRTS